VKGTSRPFTKRTAARWVRIGGGERCVRGQCMAVDKITAFCKKKNSSKVVIIPMVSVSELFYENHPKDKIIFR
jgi:hypothetical protein